MTLRLSVIVLSYNRFAETTGPCLSSLRADPALDDYEILVVDNASDDGTRSALRAAVRLHPAMRLMENPANLGYAGGNNGGMRVATGEIFYSSTATPGCLRACSDALSLSWTKIPVWPS